MRRTYIYLFVLIFFLGGITSVSPFFDNLRNWFHRVIGTDSAFTVREIDAPHALVRTEVEERIILETQDGCRRNGILTLRPNARANIILCHPATFDKEFMKTYVDEVFSEYNCLRFDFRRHGEDAAAHYSTCGKDEVYEVEAAVNHLKTHPATKDLSLYGFGISLGAAVLILAESQHHMFDGLILQSTFERLSTQIRRTVPLFNFPLFRFFMFREPTKFYMQKRYGVKLHRINPIKEIKKIKTPMFLIHAKDDACIAFKAFEALRDAGGYHIVRTWTPETGEHTKLYSHRPEEYREQCCAFLDSLAYQKSAARLIHDPSQPACDHALDGYRVSLTATVALEP